MTITPAGPETSLEDRAYDAVLGWLMHSGARPGDVVPLRELARRLGMSRTPVRFAVGRLHEQELVAYSPKLGFTVASPTPADLLELFDLRTMCESHAVRHFFERGARPLPREIVRLAQQGMELSTKIVADPQEVPLFSRRDAEFHRAIVALGESRRLLEWFDQVNLRLVIFRLGLTVPLTEERFRRSAAEHLDVADALEQGDGEEARRLLEAHVSRIRAQTIQRMLHSGGAAAALPAWLSRQSLSQPSDTALGNDTTP